MGQIDLHFYAWMIFRRLPFIILMSVVGAVIGVAVALSLKPTYQAVAKILVESPRISADLASSAIPTDVIEQLQIMEQRLTTRSSLLEMAESMEIYPDISALSETQVAQDMRARTRLDPLIFDSPRGGSGALIFAVSFEAKDSVLASRVANAYAAKILDGNAELRRARAADALEFIRQDVDRLATALSKVEADIAAFTSDHSDALPDSIEFRRAQQANQQDRLLQINREQESLRSRRLTLKQIYAQTSGTGAASLLTPEDRIIADLRRSLAEQRAIFADTSPTIVALSQRIDALETELREKRAMTTEDTDPAGMPAELQLQLVDINNQLRFLATEKETIAKNLSDLDRTIGVTVENETVLKRLQRNYENAQSQYNDAQRRLAEALTGARIEQEAIGQKLTLIEPAIPPEKPYGPRRRYIAAGGAFGGFAFGIALVLLIEIWRAAIYRPADIGRIFEGEPLVSVPYIRSPVDSAKPKMLAGLLPAIGAFVLLGEGQLIEHAYAVESLVSLAFGRAG
jgi:protein tyrosine kinase modulator